MPTRSDNIWKDLPSAELLRPIRNTLDVAEREQNLKQRAQLLRSIAKTASDIAEKLDQASNESE